MCWKDICCKIETNKKYFRYCIEMAIGFDIQLAILIFFYDNKSCSKMTERNAVDIMK